MLLLGQVLELALGSSNILDDVDHDRAGTAGAGQSEGLTNGVGQVIDVADQVGALGDGHGDAGDVDFLEGVLADEGLGHVAGDEDHGGRIHVSGGDAGGQVAGTGAGGGKAHAHLAGGAGIAVSGVSSALLVGGQDVGDLILIVVEFVIDVQNGAAGVTEHGVNTLLQQTFQ